MTKSRSVYLVMLLLCATLAACAAEPVAYVRSSEPFLIRGEVVPVAGLRSLPAVEGDEIATQAGPAIIEFLDGSRVRLSGKTRAKIERNDTQLIIRLLAGQFSYELNAASRLKVYNGTAPVSATSGTISSGTGSATTGSSARTPIRTQALPPLSRWR